jgi:type IV pilus assembly protein PilM
MTKNKVGLDIGSFSVKMAEISTSSGAAKLIGAGLKTVSLASEDKIAGLIKTLAEESKISTKEVSISISGPSVIVRFISMPRMSDSELNSAVRFEAEKVVPFNINDCTVDFKVLAKEEHGNRLSVLLVAAKKDLIQKKIALAREANFSVSCVDVDSFATANAFLRNFQKLEPERTVAVLNIGAEYTNLCILKGGIIYFARDIAIAGNDFSAALSKGLAVSAEYGEALKASPKDKTQDVVTHTKPVMNNLIDEVKLSLSYHENQTGRGIDDIYVSGGSARLVGLEEAFLEAFGSKPLVWNPLQFLNPSPGDINKNILDNMNNSFAVSVGLALR